jgi:hypothetical protein
MENQEQDNGGLAYPTAEYLTRDALGGLRGWPDNEPGRKLLIRTVHQAALSVAHARAFLAVFDNICPTPREIKESAWNLRERFLPPELPAEQKWKAEGYDYDPSFYERIAAQFAEGRKSGQPTMDEEMWSAIKRGLRVRDFSHAPFGQCWHAAQELGFPLNSHQREEMVRWLSTQGGKALAPLPEKRAVAANTITWEDVQEAQRQKQAAKESIKQADNGNNGDEEETSD